MTIRENLILISVMGLTAAIVGYRINRTPVMVIGLIILVIAGLSSFIKNDIPRHSPIQPSNSDKTQSDAPGE